jgi:hypothetical protein
VHHSWDRTAPSQQWECVTPRPVPGAQSSHHYHAQPQPAVAAAAALPAAAAAAAPLPADHLPVMTLRDEEGREVRLVANSDPIDYANFHGLSLVLEQPIFFCQRARLVATQRKAQPVLLLTSRDWQQLMRPKITHQGAFGSDFAVLTALQIAERFVHEHSSYDPRIASDWVAVWKFPADLNRIPTFRAIEGIPLPVGSYRFQDDGWWVPNQMGNHHLDPPLFPALPLNQCAVEKMRTDLPGGDSVHHLERDGGSAAHVAAISSSYFIKGFWDQHIATKPKIVAMLQELYAVGVYAFPCYRSHHAIVFYADLAMQPASVLSPRLFCERVLAYEPRRSIVLDALHRAALPKKHASLARWSKNYLRVFSGHS